MLPQDKVQICLSVVDTAKDFLQRSTMPVPALPDSLDLSRFISDPLLISGGVKKEPSVPQFTNSFGAQDDSSSSSSEMPPRPVPIKQVGHTFSFGRNQGMMMPPPRPLNKRGSMSSFKRVFSEDTNNPLQFQQANSQNMR